MHSKNISADMTAGPTRKAQQEHFCRYHCRTVEEGTARTFLQILLQDRRGRHSKNISADITAGPTRLGAGRQVLGSQI
jgi:hypothetical protein